MISTKYLVTCLFILATLTSFAQVKYTINGQYMNRAEYRHGFSTLAAPNQDAAFFISQRARLMADLKFDKAQIYLSIQDIRTWGSTSNAGIDNAGLLSVYEAWIGLQLNNKLKLNVGRQEIAYDEDRIFGSLDWLMQGRRHDAAILKYYDSASKTMIHAGFAYNQDKEQLAGTTYTVPNNYKTFQYLYFNKAFGKIKTSFLFLNNGLQFEDKNSTPSDFSTVFSQTFGPRLTYKEDGKKLSWNAAFYYQTGKNNQNRSLAAYDALGEIAWQFTKEFSLTAGVELLSGTNETSTSAEKNKSFTPFYGTNHRFNGYMDYFYVGNHNNSVGLQDVYAKALFKRSKVFYGLAYHLFSSSANIQDDTAPGTNTSNKKLGSELDFTVNYNYSNGISIQAGYSQMMATKNMEYLKNVPEGSKQNNNWTYLMLIVRPGVAWPKTGLKL